MTPERPYICADCGDHTVNRNLLCLSCDDTIAIEARSDETGTGSARQGESAGLKGIVHTLSPNKETGE